MFVKINLLFVLFIIFSNKYGNCIDVNTTVGTVRGQTLEILNTNVDQFLGIPYAEPPLGALRFAKPSPIKKPYTDIIDATKPKYACLQQMDSIHVVGPQSEDCLVLNVWTTSTNVTQATLKPVMFWIYGGGLAAGSIFQPWYNGSVLATQDVVVVSVNYRVGPVGFLYAGRDDAPGNVGLFDQVLALKWVRDNIHAFDGDNKQITIFGESAGSWSVSTHILSPLSKGLFQRAIMESGAHMHYKNKDTLTTDDALAQSQRMAKAFNCSVGDEDESSGDDWVQCLREVDPKELAKFSAFLTFPVLGTEFLPIKSAQHAFEDNKFNSDIDLLAGTTRNEGAILVARVFKDPSKITLDQFKMAVAAQELIGYHGIDVPKVTAFYLENINTTNPAELTIALANFMGDLWIVCPTYKFVKQFTQAVGQKHHTYFYEFMYQSAYFAKGFNCDTKTMGICHGADIPFVFGLPFIYPKDYTAEDQLFSKQVMKLWSQFAKNGHMDADWPEFLNIEQDNALMPKIRIMHPLNETILTDPYHKTCDGVWSDYY